MVRLAAWTLAAVLLAGCAIWIAPKHEATPSNYRFGYDSARAFVDIAHHEGAHLHGARYDCRVIARVAKAHDQTFVSGCHAGYAHELRVYPVPVAQA